MKIKGDISSPLKGMIQYYIRTKLELEEVLINLDSFLSLYITLPINGIESSVFILTVRGTLLQLHSKLAWCNCHQATATDFS
jgi:hypothetical protein